MGRKYRGKEIRSELAVRDRLLRERTKAELDLIRTRESVQAMLNEKRQKLAELEKRVAHYSCVAIAERHGLAASTVYTHNQNRKNEGFICDGG